MNGLGQAPGARGAGLTRAVLALVLALPVTAAAAESGPPRLLGVRYLGDLPSLVADERGFFRGSAESLNVEYTSSGRINLRKLRAGETDYAVMALTPLVIDALSDASPGEASDPVIVGNLLNSHRLNQVVTLKRTGVSRPRDLETSRVGLVKGTNAEFVWSLFARMHGLDTEGVTLVDLPVNKLPQALTDGRVEAAVLWEPWTSRTAEAADGALKNLPGSSSYNAHWVLVGRRSFVDSHPELTRDLLQGYIRAIDWIDTHREQALAFYANRTRVPQARLERNWAVFDYSLDLGWSVLNSLQLQLQWASDAGYGTAGAPSPEVLELLEPAPLRKLDKLRVSIPAPADGRAGQP
jgi:ABC-type nitrate/sulfonate/bicarbonate transport system substrate-binding protein